MERDDEVKTKRNIGGGIIIGKGNSYTTHYRSYDPRNTRWWSLDPKPTASESWYVGLGNNPNIFTDIRGDENYNSNDDIFHEKHASPLKPGPEKAEPANPNPADVINAHIGGGIVAFLDNFTFGLYSKIAPSSAPKNPVLAKTYNDSYKFYSIAISVFRSVKSVSSFSMELLEEGYDIYSEDKKDGGKTTAEGIEKAVENTAESTMKKGVCFPENTLVLTKDGLVPIQNLQIGDSLWTYNTESEQIELAVVENIFERKANNFVKLHFVNDSVTCTPEHPFFVDNNWVQAKELQAGDLLLNANGESVSVTSVLQYSTDTATTVYNLSAACNHNFYVSASGVLVHNCNFDIFKSAANILDKGGLTKVGRSLQKHSSRQGSIFQKVVGNAEQINAQGNIILNNILSNPNVKIITRHHARFGDIIEFITPNGGARFSADGTNFIGFIEP